MEIEKKYLIGEREALARRSFPCREIVQGYLSLQPERRIRRIGEDYFLTKKQGEGLVREEEETSISREEFERLLTGVQGNLIEKTRYFIPLPGGLTAELDLFHGRLEGLRMAEVEFPDEEAARAFQAPDWFGREVTEDPRYRNRNLSALADAKGLC